MRRILKYIPVHMENSFVEYVAKEHGLTSKEIESSDRLESIAGEYLFKTKKEEKKDEKSVVEKTEKEVFDGICEKKFTEVLWANVTDISHSEVRIPDSVIPVFALDIMYGDKLSKRIVMRDYEKSLRFMGHVYSLWLSRCERTY